MWRGIWPTERAGFTKKTFFLGVKLIIYSEVDMELTEGAFGIIKIEASIYPNEVGSRFVWKVVLSCQTSKYHECK